MDHECKSLKKRRLPKRDEQRRCLIAIAKYVTEATVGSVGTIVCLLEYIHLLGLLYQRVKDQ